MLCLFSDRDSCLGPTRGNLSRRDYHRLPVGPAARWTGLSKCTLYQTPVRFGLLSGCRSLATPESDEGGPAGRSLLPLGSPARTQGPARQSENQGTLVLPQGHSIPGSGRSVGRRSGRVRREKLVSFKRNCTLLRKEIIWGVVPVRRLRVGGRPDAGRQAQTGQIADPGVSSQPEEMRFHGVRGTAGRVARSFGPRSEGMSTG